VTPLEDQIAKVTIEVIDEGIGLSKEDIKNLFSPFFKTSD
jgi:signal transduction histidine kinase